MNDYSKQNASDNKRSPSLIPAGIFIVGEPVSLLGILLMPVTSFLRRLMRQLRRS